MDVCYSAVSEVLGTPLPYDDVLSLRDRLWDVSPTLVHYDVVEPVSTEIVLTGLKQLTSRSNLKASGQPFKKPLTNFYQTDPISRAYVL